MRGRGVCGGVWKEMWGTFLGGFEGLNGVDVGWRNVWLNLWYRIIRYKKYGFPVHGFTFLVGGAKFNCKGLKIGIFELLKVQKSTYLCGFGGGQKYFQKSDF